MPTYRIEVTQEDIDAGVKCDGLSCPIAIAVNRAIPGVQTDMDGHRMYIMAEGTKPVKILSPAEAAQFAMQFDHDFPVAPFAFTLELPEIGP